MGRVIRDYQRTGGVKEVGAENNNLCRITIQGELFHGSIFSIITDL
jgi:hypothetical protein